MCGTCGCGNTEKEPRIFLPGEVEKGHEHHHKHSHSHGESEHPHPHSHHHHHHVVGHAHEHSMEELHLHSDHEHTHEVRVEQDILNRNKQLAERNRGYFEALEIRAFNLVSSPGSGKTTLLEKTIPMLMPDKSVYVIEGDQQTSFDAQRISASGAPAVQINTGDGCHLDAAMVKQAVDKLKPAANSIVFIENVGNLVCPALFDLGESKRVVIISVTEGDDKPLKYPNMFQSADLCIINKKDLLPYVPFNLGRMKEAALKVNHKLEFIELSALNGEGLEAWISWLNK